MQPLFAHHVLYLGVWLASLLLWRVMEAGVDIWTFKRLRTGIRRQDKGSHLVLLCLIVFGFLLGVLLAWKVPAAVITSAPDILFWLGILLIFVGIALRLSAILMLGAFFTTTVAIAPEQTVIETGPYRLIRHPSYTGLLLILLGFGLSLTNNWLSLLVIMACALIGLSYRIRVEEHVLQEQLGQRYQEYMRRTKRLIPFCCNARLYFLLRRFHIGIADILARLHHGIEVEQVKEVQTGCEFRIRVMRPSRRSTPEKLGLFLQEIPTSCCPIYFRKRVVHGEPSVLQTRLCLDE